MRWALALLLFSLIHGAAFASEDARRSQVDAAIADAQRSLMQEVIQTPLLSDLSVHDLLDRTGGSDELAHVLGHADQIGGARWIDEQTCQVRLEIGGDIVAQTLSQLTAAHAKELGVSAEQIRQHLLDWKQRTFSATGTSTAGAIALRLVPPESQRAWRSVSTEERRKAVEAARQNAIQRVLDSIFPIEIGGSGKIADALSGPAPRAIVLDWLNSRPITSVEFADDLEVRLALAAPYSEFWPVLKASLARQTTVPVPAGDTGWLRLAEQVESRMAVAVGRSMAEASAPSSAPPAAVAVPVQPPEWVRDSVAAEGGAAGGGSKLRTARAAEAVAIEHLRVKLGSLPLAQGLTLEDAAKKDPRIEEALARSLAHARTSKVEYDDPTPGSVRVRVALELDDVWREIAGR